MDFWASRALARWALVSKSLVSGTTSVQSVSEKNIVKYEWHSYLQYIPALYRYCLSVGQNNCPSLTRTSLKMLTASAGSPKVVFGTTVIV